MGARMNISACLCCRPRRVAGVSVKSKVKGCLDPMGIKECLFSLLSWLDNTNTLIWGGWSPLVQCTVRMIGSHWTPQCHFTVSTVQTYWITCVLLSNYVVEKFAWTCGYCYWLTWASTGCNIGTAMESLSWTGAPVSVSKFCRISC